MRMITRPSTRSGSCGAGRGDAVDVAEYDAMMRRLLAIEVRLDSAIEELRTFNPQMERTTDDDVVAQGLRAAGLPVRKLSRHEELLADITAEDAKIARLDAALWAL